MASFFKASRFLTTSNPLQVWQKILKHNIQRRYISGASVLRHYGPSILPPEEVKKMHHMSLLEPENFWREHGHSKLNWIEDFQKVSNSDMSKGKHEWFVGGKLNVSGIPFLFGELRC